MLVKTMSRQTLVERFRSARSDPSLVLLEGFHPIKHALRFGAELIEVVGLNPEDTVRLEEDLAPDLSGAIAQNMKTVSASVFDQLAPAPPPTGVIAIAKRPPVSLVEVFGDPSPVPVVLLENPRNLLNIGAAVRASAAAGAAGLVITGRQDPWHPAALIAATGLQFALPVTRTDTLPGGDRPLVVIDPSGEPLRRGSIPDRAVLVFGEERSGISAESIAAADRRVSIPMHPGVSSLNLASAVAVVLYEWRLEQRVDAAAAQSDIISEVERGRPQISG